MSFQNKVVREPTERPAWTASLHVQNPKVLAYGSRPSHAVTHAGSIIGSCTLVDWLLADTQGGVARCHCEVRRIQGAFCLVDRCGRTFVNGHTQPLGIDRAVRLTHSDVFTVGPYKVLVNLAAEAIDWTGAIAQQGDPLAVLHDEGLQLARSGGGIMGKTPYTEAHRAIAEELSAWQRLSRTLVDEAFLDPLELLVDDMAPGTHIDDVLALLELPAGDLRNARAPGGV